MGNTLSRIYQLVEEKGGLPGRMKLAQATGVTQQQAAEAKDKAETVKRFKKAATEILGIDINELLK
jgi:Mrp family chromosome partitioning ATPase